jgi:hypothetical protein
MRSTPTWPEAIRLAISSQLVEFRVSLPGRVESYDASKVRANVKPLIKRGYFDEERQRQVESFPVIPDVPVCFPGGGGSRLTFPVKSGDIVLLVFSDFSLDKWLATGGEVDPLDDRAHTLSDAVALVGLHDFATVLAASADGTVLEGDDIRLGSADVSSGNKVALKSDLDTLHSAITTYEAANPTDPSGFASALVTALSSWPTCASKVKAK